MLYEPQYPNLYKNTGFYLYENFASRFVLYPSQVCFGNYMPRQRGASSNFRIRIFDPQAQVRPVRNF